MKKVGAILITMFGIAGLLMAGSEAETITRQMVQCTAGVCVMAIAAGAGYYFYGRG